MPRTAGTPAAGPAAIHSQTSSLQRTNLEYPSTRYFILLNLDKALYTAPRENHTINSGCRIAASLTSRTPSPYNM